MKQLIVLLFIWAWWLASLWWFLIADWIFYWVTWASAVWSFLVLVWIASVLKATDLLNNLK